MVSTTMSNARRVSFFVPDPQSFATSAVATIGIQNYTRGYWPHALQVWGFFVVAFFQVSITYQVEREMKM